MQHWGKCQSTEQMLKAVRGLYGDYIHNIFQEYMYILSSTLLAECPSSYGHLDSSFGSGHKSWRGTELVVGVAPIHPILLVPGKLYLKPFKEAEKQITSLPVASQESISSAS